MLVVASGHNEVAKWPDPPYPGEFAGRQLHALDYGEADEFRGQRVLVVGMGNSAMDIATDISHVAERTFLSVRRGSWVIPKRLLGQPADQVIRPWVAVHVPWRLRQPLSQPLLRLTVGPPERYGLPGPSAGSSRPTRRSPTPSSAASATARSRRSPGIDALGGDAVAFTDGSEEPVDAIVWCTGYRVAIPFLDESLVGPDPKELPLYKRILHLDCPDLFFVGLMQSTGSAFPIVERQSQLLAEHLAGDWRCRRRRSSAATASAATAARSRAGATTAARRCASTSTASCTSSARARARARPGGRVSRRALVTGASGAFGTRAPRRAAQPRLGGGRARPAARRRRGARLRRHRRRRRPARGRRGRAAARRRSTRSSTTRASAARPARASRPASTCGR